MHLTQKQLTIMTVVVAGDGKDAAGNLIPVDMDQLLERIDYKTTKESMQFSIRALIKNGFIYKGGFQTRRGRTRVVFFPTELGKQMTKLGASTSYLEPAKDDVEELLEPSTPAAEGFVVESNT